MSSQQDPPLGAGPEHGGRQGDRGDVLRRALRRHGHGRFDQPADARCDGAGSAAERRRERRRRRERKPPGPCPAARTVSLAVAGLISGWPAARYRLRVRPPWLPRCSPKRITRPKSTVQSAGQGNGKGALLSSRKASGRPRAGGRGVARRPGSTGGATHRATAARARSSRPPPSRSDGPWRRNEAAMLSAIDARRSTRRLVEPVPNGASQPAAKTRAESASSS